MIYLVYHSPESGAGLIPCLDEASAKEQLQVLKDVGMGLFTIIEGKEIAVEGAVEPSEHEAELSPPLAAGLADLIREGAEGAGKLFAALEQDRQRLAKVSTLPYTEAVEHCRTWILSKGAATRSAEVLTSLLLSLANEGLADLADVRVLDAERRLWLVTLTLHIHKLSNNELRYAAGLAWGEDG